MQRIRKYLIRAGILLAATITLILGLYFYYFLIYVGDYFNPDAGYYNVGTEGVAIGGYDLVGYFRENNAIKGNEMYVQVYDSIKYIFASEENRSAFIENPELYLPQYGGYCAFGLGMDVGDGIGINKPGKYPSNPRSFKIIDGRLYLFHDSPMFDALEHWEKNEHKFLNKANERWAVIGEPSK